MKRIAHLLLVLILIGFSACGSKKNKTDNNNSTANQFCTSGICYNSSSGSTGYTGSIANLSQLSSVLSTATNAGFVQQLNSVENFYMHTGTIGSKKFLGFIPVQTFNETSTSLRRGFRSSASAVHEMGSTYSEIQGGLVSIVNSGVAFQQVNNGYQVLMSNGDIYTINLRHPIAANPIEYYNDATNEFTKIDRITTGF